MRVIKTVEVLVYVVCVVGVVAACAQARADEDDFGGRRGEWREYQWRENGERDLREDHWHAYEPRPLPFESPGYYAPFTYYAPPPAYYVPPPPVYFARPRPPILVAPDVLTGFGFR